MVPVMPVALPVTLPAMIFSKFSNKSAFRKNIFNKTLKY